MYSNDGSSLMPHSPLFYFTKKNKQLNAKAAVRFEEINEYAYYTLRGNTKCESFLKGIEHLLSLSLPLMPKTTASNDFMTIFWLSPDEWLVMIKKDMTSHFIDKINETLDGHFALVDISSGQTLLRISGEASLCVLVKSCRYDFSDENFAINYCVQTKFAKASAIIFRRDKAVFDLIIRRSFAEYIAAVCLDAASEFGYGIEE